MPDKNLTDNEVVRILEETIEYNNRIGRPTAIMDIYSLELFLELIKRQNEQLQANSDSRQTNEFKNIDVARFEAKINRLQAENDELKSDIAILKDSNINLQELYQTEREKVTKAKQKVIGVCKMLKTAKAEAYKEFANWQEIKLANNPNISTVALQSIIKTNDNLLKELVGE